MPTSYLLDTNTVTALANGDATALGHLRGLQTEDEVCSCFVVLGEWEYGIHNAPGQQRQAAIRAAGAPLFAALSEVWESSPAVALAYGTFMAALRANGQLIPTNDIWIAATAQVHGATVVTADPHFRRIAGLLTVDWTRP